MRKWANSVSTLSEHCATRMTTGERDPQSQTLLLVPQDMVNMINHKKRKLRQTNRASSVTRGTDQMTNESRSDSRQRYDFPFSKAPTQVLGPTRHLTQEVLRALALGVKRSHRDADHHLHLVSRLRMSAVTPSLP